MIAPDLLGHGASDKPRADYAVAAYACGMRDLLSVLDIDRVTVVGHSLGGGIAMQFAYQFPERCERLVLVGTGGVGREVHPLLRLAAPRSPSPAWRSSPPAPVRSPYGRWPRCSASGLRLGRDFDYVLDRYRALAARPPRGLPAHPARRGRHRRPGHHHARPLLPHRRDADPDPLGRAVTASSRSSTRTPPTGRCPAANWRSSTDSGHFPHQDEPERFAKTVESFIAATAPQEFDPARWRAILRQGRPRSPEVSSGT